MKRLIWILSLAIVACSPAPSGSANSVVTPNENSTKQDPLDYDRVLPLDNEALVEQGIAKAYNDIIPTMKKLGVSPKILTEKMGELNSSYRINFDGKTFVVWDGNAPVMNREMSYCNAPKIFFDIVNSQMGKSPYRFYALMGGNDLAAIYLTDEEFKQARVFHQTARDRPYTPDLSSIECGQS